MAAMFFKPALAESKEITPLTILRADDLIIIVVAAKKFDCDLFLSALLDQLQQIKCRVPGLYLVPVPASSSE